MVVLPGLWVKNINSIKWGPLKRRASIKYLIFDKDETLTDLNQSPISKHLTLNTFRDIFNNFESNVFLLSNNKINLIDETALNPLRSEISYKLREGSFRIIFYKKL